MLIDSILFCYNCPEKAVKKNVVRKKYVKTFYCDLILLLRQNKSDDWFSKNSSFRILDSYFRMCLQLLMHKKTRFTSYSKWCRNISWRRQFMIWHHFEFLLTGLLILEILLSKNGLKRSLRKRETRHYTLSRFVAKKSCGEKRDYSVMPISSMLAPIIWWTYPQNYLPRFSSCHELPDGLLTSKNREQTTESLDQVLSILDQRNRRGWTYSIVNTK